MSEETNESREDRLQKIIDRIIADRQVLRGKKFPVAQKIITEIPDGMTVEINFDEIAMPDPASEREWRQVDFGTEGETMVPPPADE